jgi:hypothetical protein
VNRELHPFVAESLDHALMASQDDRGNRKGSAAVELPQDRKVVLEILLRLRGRKTESEADRANPADKRGATF